MKHRKFRSLFSASFVAMTAFSLPIQAAENTVDYTKNDHNKNVIGYITSKLPPNVGTGLKDPLNPVNHYKIPVDMYTVINWSAFGVAKDGSLHSADLRNDNIYKTGEVQAPASLLSTELDKSRDLTLLFGEYEKVSVVDPKDEVLIKRITNQGITYTDSTWTHTSSGITGGYPIPVKVLGGELGIIDYAHRHDTKVIASIGGRSMSKHFPEVAADAVKRAKLMADIKTLMKMGFDGVDIQWVYPGTAGMNIENYDTVNDYKNFTLLMKDIRTAVGPDKLVSAVFSGNIQHLEGFEWIELAEVVNYFNIMSHGYNGGWSDTAKHHSGIYSNSVTHAGVSALDSSDVLNWSSLLGWLVVNNIPPEKINMGISSYGYGVVVDKTATTAPGAATVKRLMTVQPDGPINSAIDSYWGEYNGKPSYYLIQTKIDDGWMRHRDSETYVPYLTKGAQFLSYDDVESIQVKAQYVLDYTFGGVVNSGIMGDVECVDTTNTSLTCISIRSPLAQAVNNTLANKGSKDEKTSGPCKDANVYPNWPQLDWQGKPSHANSGDEVAHNGILYRAKWWTTSVPGSDGSWRKVDDC